MQAPHHIQRSTDAGPIRDTAKPFLQTRLEVGQPDDELEQEANAVADRVMMQPEQDDEIAQMQPAEEEESLQMQSEEEEEPLQMQTEDEEEMVSMEVDEDEELARMQPEEEDELLNMQSAEEEESLQMQTEDEEEMVSMEVDEEEEPLQMKAGEEDEILTKTAANTSRSTAGQASPELSSMVRSTKGAGSPLEPGIQREMGNKIGANFSGVNVHTDQKAAQMNRELGAKAFTVGNDVYFNQGQYNPGSSSGKHLLAHELTHTVQQGAVKNNRIQKQDDADAGEQPEMDLSTGILDESAKTIEFDHIPVPGFKLLDHRGALYDAKKPLKRKRDYKRGTTNQRNGVWKVEVDTDNIVDRLKEIYRENHRTEPDESDIHVYVANVGGRSVGISFIGSFEDIALELTTPTWGKDKEYRRYDVDHIVELQLANWNEESWPNDIENMELLESSRNRSSGSVIQSNISGKLNSFREIHGDEFEGSEAFFKENYTLVFQEAVSMGQGGDISENEFWTQDQIEDAEHLEPLEIGNLADIGGDDEVRIFPNSTGGLGKRFYWDESETDTDSSEATWLGNPFRIVSKEFNTSGEGVENTDELGTLYVNIPENDDTWESWPENKEIPVKRFKGSKYAGYIEKHSWKSKFYNLRNKQTSPVELHEAELTDQGIRAHGEILPSLEIFKDAPIEFSLIEGELRVSKTFSTEEINVPPPFAIKNSSLTIFASSEAGLGLSGETDFEIQNVGEGNIQATTSTSGGFELAGSFSFDTDLFNPAEIGVAFKEDSWEIEGELGIPPGKVKGISRASIEASYADRTLEASGEAELDIPGIEKGTMEVQFGEEGFSIGGAFDISSDVPGIRGGEVSARVTKDSDEDEYSISVSGQAEPDIPGVSANLFVSYEDGAFTIFGVAGYSRGMLDGTVQIGATNRSIDEEGEPEGEPDDTMRVYGGGELTLQLTPWLEATAGVNFLPNGEMEVRGRIGLPDTVDIFPRKEINRNLFRVPTIEIPLFAIPLGPRSIGLVAQIGGGLDFEAGFGPGQLRQLEAEVTYNPDREEETTLAGRGEFVIPADAGLTLRADASLGVSVAVASLTGGIELAGTLGLEGEAAASVDVNWSPQDGIALDAEGSVTVHPKFEFNVNAFARGSLGVGWLSVSKTWRHNLTSFEWGPDIQFGIIFPIEYREGEPFDLSFDDIEVIYPDLDIPELAKSLGRDIKDDIFD